jgi:hypothetical protein
MIRCRMLYGVAITMVSDEYQSLAPRGWPEYYGHPYTVCLHVCLSAIGHWAERTGCYDNIAYFFESGHRHSGQASQRLDELSADAAQVVFTRHAAHAFVDKRVARPLAAADYLAWHAYQDRGRVDRATGTRIMPRRRDFDALLLNQEERYWLAHLTPDGFRQMFADHRVPGLRRRGRP